MYRIEYEEQTESILEELQVQVQADHHQREHVGGNRGYPCIQAEWCVCTSFCGNRHLPDSFADYHLYPFAQLSAGVYENALRADSLQWMLERQRMYIMNIQDIISGNVKVDSVHSIDSLTAVRSEELMERTQAEDDFRKQYEETERYNLTTIDNAPAVTGLIFFRPTRGMISSEFDAAKKHYGIDIAASPNESVLATLDGTVMLATYTADTGYVIQVQHGQNLVSIYKHCGSLLKKVGDTVKAGEAIALVGNTGEKTTGPHLHFEIWNRGRALDPSKYIVF